MPAPCHSTQALTFCFGTLRHLGGASKFPFGGRIRAATMNLAAGSTTSQGENGERAKDSIQEFSRCSYIYIYICFLLHYYYIMYICFHMSFLKTCSNQNHLNLYLPHDTPGLPPSHPSAPSSAVRVEQSH